MNPPPHFTPEQNILLYCARSRFLDAYPGLVKHLLEQGINWKTLINLAETHKLTQLLYQNLKLVPTEVVPLDVMQQLQKIYTSHMQYILYLTAELVSVVKTFYANGIPILPYKGPVLATQVYGNLALRPINDLDILVPINELPRAKQLLLDKGYQVSWPEMPLSRSQEKAHIRSKYNYQFIQYDRNITLELHWGVTPRYFSFPSSRAWLWQDLQTLTIGGVPMSAFSPEKLLLILCVHGGNHLWDRVGWICDISELVTRYPDLNWDSVLRDASRFGVYRLLLAGLRLAHDFFDTRLPHEIWERIEADTEVKWLAQNTVRRFAAFRWSGDVFLGIPIYHLRSRERLRDKANYCMQIIVPSNKDWNFISLPKELDFLYYLIRPVRLAYEYGITPILKR